MPTSSLYISLQDRIGQLDKHFLSKIDPSRQADECEVDLIRAYCLLSHAEFENYIEQSILATAEAAMKKWQKKPNDISAIILSFLLINNENISPSQKIHKSFNDLKSKLEKNHGIKTHNIDNITKPIGFVMDGTLQATLHSFGGTRGDIAHNSHKTTHALDMNSEKSTVAQILTGLKQFDIELAEYEAQDKLNRNDIRALRPLSFKDRIKFLLKGYY